MADRYFNPFQSVDVSVPAEYHEAIVRYVRGDGSGGSDASPFPRMVDMWFLAVCVAAHEGLPPDDNSKRETRKIIDGSIFSSDPWRVNALMLLAIARTGGTEIILEPSKMMALANGLAVAGLPLVLEMITDGTGEAIWNLSEALEKLTKAH